MKMFFQTSPVIKKTRCSLINGFIYLFVVRIDSKGYLKKAENDSRRIVNIDLWRVKPRSYRSYSKIYYTRDRCYYFKYFVEPFINSYVLFLLLIYKISEKLNGIFHYSLYIHTFKRFKWRGGVFLQRLSFLMFGNIQTARQTVICCYL